MSQYSPSPLAPNYEFRRGLSRPSETGSPLVLMVEDRPETRSELTEMLERKGYRVVETDNGQDAVRRALHVCPDLLLVDLNVPLLYQIVAARQIIKHAGLGNLPVVISAHEDVVDTATFLELGVRRNEYVTRLSNAQQLKCLLDYLLTKNPQAA
jgi:CheY-like chemotaxis protein